MKMKLIPLNEIFDIEYGNQFDFSKMNQVSSDESGINFISRSSKNFGIVGKVQEIGQVEPYPAGLITVTLGGSYLLTAFIQPGKFYTAQNIKVLKPKERLSFNEKIYYCLCIDKNRFRYSSHGREANTSLDNLLVPFSVPLHFKNISLSKLLKDTSKPILTTHTVIKSKEFTDFKLTKLFKITGTKTTPIKKLIEYGPGPFPYVTTQTSNNGIAGFFNYYTEFGNVLTIDSAVNGYCAYQEFNFSASDHVEKLIPFFNMNKYVGLFIVSVLNLERFRFNYGRKAAQMRLKQMSIKLPSINGKPDFAFMEEVIKGTPYSKVI